MNLVVNGEVKHFDSSELSVSDLLKECKVQMPDMVSVQVNGDFVDRAAFGQTSLRQKDEVDFLYFMGGGQ